LSTKNPKWAGLELVLCLHDERLETCFWWLIYSLLFFISFVYLCFFPPLFCVGVSFGYFFGYDLISYGLILLSLWICILMVLAIPWPHNLLFSLYCINKHNQYGNVYNVYSVHCDELKKLV
jgi:hypothetical protein